MNRLHDYLTSRNVYTLFLHVAVVVLAVQVVILSNQNRTLKEGRQAKSRDQIKEGDTLQFIQLEPLKPGLTLDTSSARQLVFLMTTTCPFCKETIPVWKELSAKVGKSIPVLAISLDTRDSTSKFVEGNGISFPVAISRDAAAFKKVNKITGVPIALIRENTGRVTKVWFGKLDTQKALEVERSALIDPVEENLK